MNFLQLCQRTVEKCGIARGTAITTVVSQSGKALQLINRVSEAWGDIQSQHRDWEFKRASTSFATVAGQASYTLAEAGTSNFGQWDKQSFRNYLTATGTPSEVFMDFIDYQSWKDLYQFSSNRTATSQPRDFTILPNKSIGLGPVPLVGYTVTGDYFTGLIEMALDADTPSLPTNYHMMIVYRAMMLYAPSDAASEIYQEGQTEFKKLMSRLESDYLPEITLSGPMI